MPFAHRHLIIRNALKIGQEQIVNIFYPELTGKTNSFKLIFQY